MRNRRIIKIIISCPASGSSTSTNYPKDHYQDIEYLSLHQFKTFYQNEAPFNQKTDQTLEEMVQTHFNEMKIDDKEVLEKFLKLKKDEGPSA